MLTIVVCSYRVAAGAAEWAETAEPEANEEEDEADDPGHHRFFLSNLSLSILSAVVTGDANGVAWPQSFVKGRLYTCSYSLWHANHC